MTLLLLAITHFTREETGTERLSDLPKITQEMDQLECELKHPGLRVHPLDCVVHGGPCSEHSLDNHTGGPFSLVISASPGDLLLTEQWPTLWPGMGGLTVSLPSSVPRATPCSRLTPQPLDGHLLPGVCRSLNAPKACSCPPSSACSGQNLLHRDGELPWGALAFPDQEGSLVVPLHQNLFRQLPGDPA